MKRYVRAGIVALILGSIAGILLTISGVPESWSIFAAAAIGWISGSAFYKLT